MTDWKRYAVAVAMGLAGSAAWGVLMAWIGSDGYTVIGAVVIMIAALVWSRGT